MRFELWSLQATDQMMFNFCYTASTQHARQHVGNSIEIRHFILPQLGVQLTVINATVLLHSPRQHT